MSLLDAQVTKSPIFERVTLRGLFITFAIGTLVSFLLEIAWMFVGFAFFTAKESEVPWYYPCEIMITGLMLLSIGGLIVTFLAAIIRYFQSD